MQPTIDKLKELASLEFGTDTVLLDMMPGPMQRFVNEGPAVVKWAAERIEAQRAEVLSATNALFQLKAACAKYANEGADPMFHQNLMLCLDQVKQGR